MKRLALSDAELPKSLTRRELEKLLARAKRVIEAFATSDDTGPARERPEAAPRRPARTGLLPSPVG